MSKRSPAEHWNFLPDTEQKIAQEFAFEHLKLIYIRDLKLHRLRLGFWLFGAALLVGFSYYAVGRYALKICGG